MNRITAILDDGGVPIEVPNGKPRPEMLDLLINAPVQRQAVKASFDAARDTTEYAAHWANTDSLDADSANSMAVRHKLIRRSRYEAGSNGFYAGIIETHVNALIGVGPTLRMLTKSRAFNEEVEQRFYEWSLKVQLMRKLRCLARAKIVDGEGFALLINNPAIDDDVQLDLLPIEAEQVQTPSLAYRESGYVDGVRFNQRGEILWYDVLPEHPGSANWRAMSLKPVQVPPQAMIHWFKMQRPGQHRGIPAMTSTLNVGASSRRMREATLAAAETAADLNVMLTTQLTPDSTTDPMAPFSSMPIQKRMMTAAPMGWEAHHFKSEHPGSTYDGFIRSHVTEQARPISMPINAAMCDSSTYSFASGKLDTLCYRAELNVERQDCDRTAMDRIFAAWFQEFTLQNPRRFKPLKQWDWPIHPVIDAESEARAIDTQLKNGTTTFREAYTLQGRDYEDELKIMASDWFGETDAKSIEKARTINMLRNVPQHSLPFVAASIGIAVPQPQGAAV